ncbi:MAG: MarR family transcriptional regulator [Prolixibacteraceae bacterium]|jgi:MarR family 2-MHQ and catechol resistance regulon transcriptional repressor|nr:MarR family transcriptional regulator [Prolixibacteraceae bacterium]
MPKPHVTAIIDRLIDAGYVERQSDPKDRRIINISLTPKGSKIFETTQKLVSKNLKSKLLLLSDEELEKLSVASQQVREILLTILSKK